MCRSQRPRVGIVHRRAEPQAAPAQGWKAARAERKDEKDRDSGARMCALAVTEGERRRLGQQVEPGACCQKAARKMCGGGRRAVERPCEEAAGRPAAVSYKQIPAHQTQSVISYAVLGV